MTTTKSDLECMLFDLEAEPKPLPLSLLVEITNGFSDKLEIGRGGFAVVYKANIGDGAVAVKKMSNTYMYEKEFLREVECLMKVRHDNIVRFLGYCVDTQGNFATFDGESVMADVQHRLLCFEYVPRGSLDGYIKDVSSGLQWTKQYHIIKGICQGLYYLHEINILHLDLKPLNILLDDYMKPKITDFGLSRRFMENQAPLIAPTMSGTRGYMAPEAIKNHEITHKYDLFSLGVILMELLTGVKTCQTVEDVLESWGNRSEISQEKTRWEQVRVCAEIAIECIDFEPAKRPGSMKHIMDRLALTEEVIQPLDVHPCVLCFAYKSNKVIPCSLHLENKTNKYMAFRILENSPKSLRCFVRSPLHGRVPPRSTYTLVLTPKERNELPERRNIYLIIESTSFDCDHTSTFQSLSMDTFFEEVKEMGNEVQEVKLKCYFTPQGEITQTISSKPLAPLIEILDMGNWYKKSLHSVDANQDKQWIIIGGSSGHVHIWNYQTHRKVDSLKLSVVAAVTCVKFIVRKQWLVAATEVGVVHVYNYESKMQRVTSLDAAYVHRGVVSVAVHPTLPYLLTVCNETLKLWDWEKSWECVKIPVRFYGKIYQVAFNPKETIAIASENHDVEIRSVHSSKYESTALCGHSHSVKCVHFFSSGDQEYLVTGSTDKTAKIWDVEKRICVHTLDLQSPVISIIHQPNLQVLIAGSKDGLISIWSTAEKIFSGCTRPERIVNMSCGGALCGMAYLMGRVVLAEEHSVALLDIMEDENKNYQEETSDYSEAPLTEYRRPGDTTSKVLVGCSTELLDVHPLELRFHLDPDQQLCNPCSLRLTNKTDEHVAFRIVDRGAKYQFFSSVGLPLYGIVHARSTSTVIVTLSIEKESEKETVIDLVLQSSISGDKYTAVASCYSECDDFFEEAKELGHAVHEVALKPLYTLAQPESQIIHLSKFYGFPSCVDAHPTEPWIVMGYDKGDVSMGYDKGDVSIWNWDTQKMVHKFNVSKAKVCSIKFDASKKWIVARTSDYSIHVYDCVSITQTKRITSFTHSGSSTKCSIAVHPVKPYLVSTSMEFWDGEKGWERTTLGKDYVDLLTFNPEDPNNFASVSFHRVYVSSLDSSESSCLSGPGHSERVNCLAYFACGGKQYLITGSEDCTAKIWDLQKMACIHTLEGFMSPVYRVISLPGRPYLVTLSGNRTIHVWSSTDFRPKRTIHFSYGSCLFVGLIWFMGSQRFAIVDYDGTLIMDIDDDEETISCEESECVTD